MLPTSTEMDPQFVLTNGKTSKNRGTGAGGSNTNKNGLPYEELTDLNDMVTVVQQSTLYSKVTFSSDVRKTFIKTKQANLFKYMNSINELNTHVEKAHGCKNPDECYIDTVSKNMFVIEKKFQQCSGSVCEKIQTGPFKLWQYTRTFPKYKIVYVYCLSAWFKENCKSELEYLAQQGIPVFWGNSTTYKQDIVDFIVNYK